MTRKLEKHGDKLALQWGSSFLVFNENDIEKLGLAADEELEVSLEEGRLNIRLANGASSNGHLQPPKDLSIKSVTFHAAEGSKEIKVSKVVPRLTKSSSFEEALMATLEEHRETFRRLAE